MKTGKFMPAAIDERKRTRAEQARERQRRFYANQRARILEQRKQQRARLHSVEVIIEPDFDIEEEPCSPAN
jgi:hypothetical protein